MRAEPIARGAMAPASGLRTVAPMVRTRKKVPMNSTRYFFIRAIPPSGTLAVGHPPGPEQGLSGGDRRPRTCPACDQRNQVFPLMDRAQPVKENARKPQNIRIPGFVPLAPFLFFPSSAAED